MAELVCVCASGGETKGEGKGGTTEKEKANFEWREQQLKEVRNRREVGSV